jgi:hypothetical protein
MMKNKNSVPVAAWVGDDLGEEGRSAIKSLTVIIRGAGCQWKKCTMCGYWRESSPEVTPADIVAQLENALKKRPSGDFMLKVFTSGSFFDEREIGENTRTELMKMVAKKKEIKKMIVETRPEFVSVEKINQCKRYITNFEVAIGLETSNDFIRDTYINKGFSFDDYKRAARIIKKCHATVKTYLLLKPPFVSEKGAIEDMVKSATDVYNFSSTSTPASAISFSLNLCNVQKGTFVEKLWKKGYYRPPWLWSAVEAIKRIKELNENIVLMSDPVGAGHVRGPHNYNCGKCNYAVREAIERFNLTQNVDVLEIYCECQRVWEKILERDDFLFGTNIF